LRDFGAAKKPARDHSVTFAVDIVAVSARDSLVEYSVPRHIARLPGFQPAPRNPMSKRNIPVLASIAIAAAVTIAAAPARANVVIAVDKSAQQMSVSVDGYLRYNWAVSTARSGYNTPNGTYHPERLERSWFSRLYYNSPMPYSIFFRGGYAIHGSYAISQLGGPASHGCIRLHPQNAATLFDIVSREGTGATTIVVSGGGAGHHRH
jgi:lipoprotein-anchoring transpeptidase ErfK/SrfK